MKTIKEIELPKDYVITPIEFYKMEDFDGWWPEKWKGPAWICQAKHQIPQKKYDYGFWGGNEWNLFCPGCDCWIERSSLIFESETKQRTMGHAKRATLVPEGSEKTVLLVDNSIELKEPEVVVTKVVTPVLTADAQVKRKRGRPRKNT